MNMLEMVRESKSGSWMVAVAAYLLATGGAVYLRKTSGDSGTAELAGALLMSASLIVTTLVMRIPAPPRWSLLAASGILAAGMIVPVLIAPGAAAMDSPIGTWSYGWLYLVLVGGTQSTGPRWCHSPWIVVGAAAVLGLATAIARGRL